MVSLVMCLQGKSKACAHGHLLPYPNSSIPIPSSHTLIAPSSHWLMHFNF